jgi:hypothetical protein
VGRPILLADVGLDLDDAADSPNRAVIPDQGAAEQRPAQLEGGQGKDVADRAPYRVTGT